MNVAVLAAVCKPETDLESMSRSTSRGRSSSISSSEETRSTSEEDVEFVKNERVEAKVKGWKRYYPGKVERVHSDGTYDIRFASFYKHNDYLSSR